MGQYDHLNFTVIAGRPFGFFTNLFHILQYLKEADLENRIPIIYWVDGCYKKRKEEAYEGDNVWEYFFDPVSEYRLEDVFPEFKVLPYSNLEVKGSNVKVVRKFRDKPVSYEPDNCWNWGYPPDECVNNMTQESREYIGGLISKYIRINKKVSDKIDDFVDKHMDGCHVLGVHRRGQMDQRGAQGNKPSVRYLKRVESYLQEKPDAKVFVATENWTSLNEFKNAFGDKVIYRDTFKSKDESLVFNVPLRTVQKYLAKSKPHPGGARSGEEALIDCVLLSKCDYMLHGISNVGTAAGCFNPGLKKEFVVKYKKRDRKYLEIGEYAKK